MPENFDSLVEIAINRLEADYDTLPYYYQVSHFSHPEHLACVAYLSGFTPIPPRKARVLELACGRGVNLGAIAYSLPECDCVGVDLSSRHVEDARELVHRLELSNVHFEQGNLLDITEDFGVFDYIIVNGTYTWVPREVQDKILSICSRHLSASGVAMVHYATYPGSIGSDAVRKMMQYHLRQFSEPDERLDQALRFISFFSESAVKGNPFSGFLKLVEKGSKGDKMNFYHETLGVETSPCYFHEFMEKANAHNLRYLSDVSLDATFSQLDSTVQQHLKQIPDQVKREQYLDFLVNRGTRSSLLCHKAKSGCSALDTVIADHGFYISGVIRRAEKTDQEQKEKPDSILFESPSGIRITSESPLLVLALELIKDAWPKAVSFSYLKKEALKQFAATNDDKKAVGSQLSNLERDLLNCCRIGLCGLRMTQVNCTKIVSQKPLIYPLARIQASFKDDSMSLANVRHEAVIVDSFQLLLARYLDGTNSSSELVSLMEQFVAQGTMTLKNKGTLVEASDEVLACLEQKVNSSLKALASSGLLIA